MEKTDSSVTMLGLSCCDTRGQMPKIGFVFGWKVTSVWVSGAVKVWCVLFGTKNSRRDTGFPDASGGNQGMYERVDQTHIVDI